MTWTVWHWLVLAFVSALAAGALVAVELWYFKMWKRKEKR